MDLKTLAVALFIVSTLQVGALAAQWRIADGYRGTGWWALGIAIFTLGFGALMLRWVPGWTTVGIFGNNIAFVFGHLLLFVGVRRFFELSVPWRPLLAFGLCFTSSAAWFSFGYDHLVWRGSLLYASIATLSFLTAATLWRLHPPLLRLTARFQAGAFTAHGLIFVAGLILGLVAPPPSNSATGPNVGQLIALLDGLIMLTLWTFCFILMVNQRLSADHQQARDELALILNGTPDAVQMTRLDDGTLVEMNAGFTELLGYERAAAQGRSTLDLGMWVKPSDRERLVARLRRDGRCSGLEIKFRCRDGRVITGLVSARWLVLRGIPHVLSVIHDVSERQQLQAQLQHQASTDPLTGLLNRRSFLARTRYEMQRAQRLRQPLCLALVDIDHFKQLNDTHGHAAGDAALTGFARLCREHLRAIDLVARFGGDEFALLLPQTDGEQAEQVLQRLHTAVAQAPGPARYTLSVGFAQATVMAASPGAASEASPTPPPQMPPEVPPESHADSVADAWADETDAEPAQDAAIQALLARADQALYDAKRAGRNGTRRG